jgi:predicted glycoside hydrolase/deacetylase ChbG (UPF0249 family)
MRSGEKRQLVVIADDFGIGPATSAGILELARKRLLTGTVLLVNSPFAEAGLASWRAAGKPLEMGWHPNLTLDKPLLAREKIPSLVGRDGCFWPLATFMKRLLLGRIRPMEVGLEWRAQYHRFIDLLGHPPTIVNTHQHVGLFASIGSVLIGILHEQARRPYLRRVREPWSMLWRIRGARKKRTFLNTLGRRMSRWQASAGLPGNDWLAGVTDPRWVQSAGFFENWLRQIPGQVVELSCHPGHWDRTLIGRDCTAHDGLLQRRVDELHLLHLPEFLNAVTDAGFELVPAERFRQHLSRRTDAA